MSPPEDQRSFAGGSAPPPPDAPAVEALQVEPVSPRFELPDLRTSRVAIAALVVGIVAVLTMCFLPVLPGAAAVVLAIIAMRHTGPMQKPGRGMALAALSMGCVAIVISLLSLTILLPVVGQMRESTRRTQCESSMRAIGQAARMYALDNGGAFPPDLATILRATPTLSHENLVCPSSDDRVAGAGEILRAGQNLSYFWVGDGVTDRAGPSVVLMYEPVDHHGRDGANFLFADGTVRFIPRQQARPMISQLEQGINPPSTNTLQPGTGDSLPPADLP